MPTNMTTLYAIKHKETGRFITGTDFRYSPPRQIISDYHTPMLFTGWNLLTEIKVRHINLKRYKVCTVNIKEVNELCLT